MKEYDWVRLTEQSLFTAHCCGAATAWIWRVSFFAAVWVAAGRAPRSTQCWQGWVGAELPAAVMPTRSMQGTASANLATAVVAPPCSHLPLGAPNYMMVTQNTFCVFVKDWRLITESVF